MNRISNPLKRLFVCFAGIIWGIISVVWCGESILMLGNLMEDAGSYHYEEAESMRIYGFFGLLLYLICFVPMMMHIRNKYMRIFVFAMVLGGIGTLVYIFH